MSDRKPTPLPRKQLFILCCCRFAEPIAFTNILPFIYFMVEDFDVTDDPKQIGYFVGWVSSSFALAQFLTGLPWGALSDRIGRKPVILTGLIGTMISCLLFGLSESYIGALLSRSVAGFLCGNIGVIKSSLAEITDHTNQARAFSMLPFMYGIGCIIGPMIGGFLYQPAEQYPGLFGNNQFLRDHPYFLPCFVVACFCAFSFTIGFFFLEETLESKKQPHKKSNTSFEEERMPLLPKEGAVAEQQKKPQYSFLDLFQGSIIAVILSYVLLSLQSVMYDGLYTTWSATPISMGGLGFTAHQIGISLTCAGISTLIIQLFVYPPLQERFGTLTCYKWAMTGYVFVYFFLPFVNVAARKSHEGTLENKWVWAFLLVFIVCVRICSVICFTGSMILVTNASPSKSCLGKIHGLTQMLGSGVRAIGPAAAGALYTVSLGSTLPWPLNTHLVWTILAGLALIARAEGSWVKDLYKGEKRGEETDDGKKGIQGGSK